MTPNNFLGLPDPYADFDQAAVLVLPIPFEATVSYGGGTVDGPAAIIEASQQVELYDREFDREPAYGYGIHTLPALDLPTDPAAAIDAIAAAVSQAARTGKLVVGLGGEHTISVGFGRGLIAALGGPIRSSNWMRTVICALSMKRHPTATPASPAVCWKNQRLSKCSSWAFAQFAARKSNLRGQILIAYAFGMPKPCMRMGGAMNWLRACKGNVST